MIFSLPPLVYQVLALSTTASRPLLERFILILTMRWLPYRYMVHVYHVLNDCLDLLSTKYKYLYVTYGKAN